MSSSSANATRHTDQNPASLKKDPRAFAYIVFYALFANIPFLLAARQMGILRNGWLSLDYLAAGILALYLPRVFAPFLFLFAFFIDLLQGVSETYYLSVRVCLTNLNALSDLPPGRLGYMIFITFILLLALALAWALRTPRPRRLKQHIALCLILTGSVFVLIDCLSAVCRSGHLPGLLHPSHWSQSAALPVEYRLTRISSIRMARAIVAPAPVGFFMPSAAAQILDPTVFHASGLASSQPNIVLILVESWGKANDPAIRAALTRPFEQPAIRTGYTIFQGTVPFQGSTVTAEARELCGSNMGFHILEATAQDLASCLPHRLASLGYQVISVHGMDGNFYHRLDWYQRMGIQTMWFNPELQTAGLPSCAGSFSGICDPAIAAWIAHRLTSDQHNSQPDFIYWVTLNSHLPVTVPAPLNSPPNCAFSPTLLQQPELCSWYQLIATLQQSAAKLATDDTGHPTIFILVGDHAPPFTNATLRDQFSPSNVPYIALIPRALSSAKPK
ncbi:sulfatase-like hydrolase/transferase [Acidicapsa dinghuensis]|uniref:Sulfatase-like hydrolase/transferase n=1 Tax=Acidicapsa dinghuensis TaxID=2218256 RepID=A0ABW1EIY9_9BACT|nr:sulfatase-like hydrolase/transferase [Acidicapsa dinghuensis]